MRHQISNFVIAGVAAVGMYACPISAHAEDALRISQLSRCGDLLDSHIYEFCVRVRGRQPGDLSLLLDG
jgi:hypothetical protein